MQIDFEHKIVLNQLTKHLEEIQAFNERLKILISEISFKDLIEDCGYHQDLLLKMEQDIKKTLDFIRRFQQLLNQKNRGFLDMEASNNFDKHQIIMQESEKVDEHYQNVREKVLYFINSYS